MTRIEWIQRAMLIAANDLDVASREDTIAAIVKTADVLEKSGAAPWDPDPEAQDMYEQEIRKLKMEYSDSVVTAIASEREACAKIAEAQAEKYSEMARKWESGGDCSARNNFHEAGGAAIVGREIRDAIRRRVPTNPSVAILAFVEQEVAAEREACAKVADRNDQNAWGIAKEIRARK